MSLAQAIGPILAIFFGYPQEVFFSERFSVNNGLENAIDSPQVFRLDERQIEEIREFAQFFSLLHLFLLMSKQSVVLPIGNLRPSCIF